MQYTKRLQKFDKNKIGRDFVVGDIHGCYTILMSELEKIDFNFEKDRLFSVGDLIDRGLENEKCLELIYEKWFFPVIGNHELLMLNGIFFDATAIWYYNGGDWILRSDLFGEDIELFAKEIDLLIPFAIEITDGNKTFGIVHAETSNDWNTVRKFCQKEYTIKNLLLNKNIKEKDVDTFHKMTWSRSRLKVQNRSIIKNIDEVFVGHSITKNLTTLGNVNYIDTGAYCTGKITVKEIIF
jgi:serine/threonine protein phosphatase 1